LIATHGTHSTHFPTQLAAVLPALMRSRRKRPVILLVEDDRLLADMYRFQLEHEGYQVEVAFDGKQGLSAIRTSQPDLVLLDVRLPIMEGFEVLEQLQTDPHEVKRIPVVILSNYGDARMISRGLELGARDYLVKSATTPTILVAKIKNLLPPTSPHL
jgi:two-component system, OmpR family, phosphate regulon response regulator PhoB